MALMMDTVLELTDIGNTRNVDILRMAEVESPRPVSVSRGRRDHLPTYNFFPSEKSDHVRRLISAFSQSDWTIISNRHSNIIISKSKVFLLHLWGGVGLG